MGSRAAPAAAAINESAAAMTNEPIIRTRRLRLRAWQLGDVDAYNRHCNTEAVREFLGGKVSKREIRAEVRWFRAHDVKYGFTFWALERRRDRALLGFCGIIRVPEVKSPLHGALEIGWRVRADRWRRGYALEAARAVIEWASWELSGGVLYARIDPSNVASVGLARKLGMRRARALETLQPPEEQGLCIFKLRP